MNHFQSMRWATSLLGAVIACTATSANAVSIVQNPGFLFTAASHTDGDDDGHAVNMNTTNTPSWKPGTLPVSGFTPNVSDPQPIFNNPNEYLQVQVLSEGGTQDTYQQVIIPASGAYTLTMDADHRNDNVNTAGTLILELWSGNITGFGVGSAITPSSSSSPALTANFQEYSRAYNSLAAGSYTVRVGGTGTFFQAGIDNVNLAAVPEPSTIALGSMTALGFAAAIRRRRTTVSHATS